MRRFLTITDLDDLAAAHRELADAGGITPDAEAVVVGVLAGWTDRQALANLLMYPLLIPPDFRLAAIERALGEAGPGYLCLAAVVGVERLDVTQVPDDARYRLTRRLLDLIASDAGLLADRASISIRTLLSSGDAPELVELLLHPSVAVRQNLAQALFELTGAAGVTALLDQPGFVPPKVRIKARAQLVADGVDLDDGSDKQRFPLVLSYLPSLADWQESIERDEM